MLPKISEKGGVRGGIWGVVGVVEKEKSQSMWRSVWSTVWLSCRARLCWSGTVWRCFRPVGQLWTEKQR